MQKREWTFSKFADELRKRIAKNDSEVIYYQDALTDAVGEPIKHDFVHFNWQWLNERKKRYNWGQLTSNLLLIITSSTRLGMSHAKALSYWYVKGAPVTGAFLSFMRCGRYKERPINNPSKTHQRPIKDPSTTHLIDAMSFVMGKLHLLLTPLILPKSINKLFYTYSASGNSI